MKDKLLLIKEQLEQLTISINDYLESTAKEEIIIKPENFDRIKYLCSYTNTGSIFSYNNGAIFVLNPNSKYEKEHYDNLLAGKLDRLILKKRNTPHHLGVWIINYDLESEVETKLRDLYKNQP